MKITYDYYVYVFSLVVQGETESFDSFVARLREQAETCNFENSDREIRRQIIEKCRMDKLRDRAFARTLTLEELIGTGRAIELLGEKISRPSTSKSEKACWRCGSTDHRFYDKCCKAFGSRCQVCSVMGHLSQFCFFVRPKFQHNADGESAGVEHGEIRKRSSTSIDLNLPKRTRTSPLKSVELANERKTRHTSDSKERFDHNTNRSTDIREAKNQTSRSDIPE
jgi:hypothetical protein